MKKSPIFLLYKREMLDILRDKKTVFMNIFMPVILYPLIAIVATQVMLSVQSSMEEQTYRVAIVASPEETQQLESILLNNTKNPAATAEASPNELRGKFIFTPSPNPQEDLQAKKLDAYITISGPENEKDYTIHYISSVVDSQGAASRILRILDDYLDVLRTQKLDSLGIDHNAIWNPIAVSPVDHATQEQSIGNILGSIVPILLIIGLVTGATQTAIDATAGEKERGTLETLFSLPVTSKDIILSKFGAVATMASISVLLNFLSIGAMGYYFFSLVQMMAPENMMNVQLSSFLPVVLVVFLCVLLFGIFISALTLTLFVFAKTVKEAQNYSTPLIIVIMLIGYVGFIPNFELSLKTAAIPVVNVVLLIKSVFNFNYNITLILLVLATNLAYGILAVQLMSKAYNSEELLFGDDSSFLNIFEKRSNIRAGGMPSPGEGLFLLLLGILSILYIGSYFQIKYGFYGLLSIQATILILPFAMAIYSKYDLKKVFSLRLPSFSHALGAVLLWIGTLIGVTALSALLSKLFPQSYESLEVIEKMFSGKSLLALTLVVAVAPAICEELFFRGFIFSSFRGKMGPYAAMLLASTLFGIYHMSLIKFFTTALLGLSINYALYKSNSIVTASLMHFLNNFLSVTAVYYQDKLSAMLPENTSPEMAEAALASQTNPLLIVALVVIFAGAGILLLNKKRNMSLEE